MSNGSTIPVGTPLVLNGREVATVQGHDTRAFAVPFTGRELVYEHVGLLFEGGGWLWVDRFEDDRIWCVSGRDFNGAFESLSPGGRLEGRCQTLMEEVAAQLDRALAEARP
jgi:hypothetical protein